MSEPLKLGSKLCPNCGRLNWYPDHTENRNDLCWRVALPREPGEEIRCLRRALQARTERDKLVSRVAEAAMHLPIACLKSEPCPFPEIAEVWRESMDELWKAASMLAAFDVRPLRTPTADTLEER